MVTPNPASGTAFSPQQALKHYFGYDSFRLGQQEIIEQALQNRDLLVIMPTGGGKSLCFQLPALLKTGVMIVVSPLIALMQDQVQALQDNGIGATFLNSSLTLAQVRERRQAILSGQIKLLYAAPEGLMGEELAAGLLPQIHKQVGISAFAIDEAHCVSEWGHDFRPEYRQLSQLRRRYPEVPMMALTATATERVRRDIIQQLHLQQPSLHLASFNRPNLYYEVRPKQKTAYAELLASIRKEKGAGIIYCLSRRQVDELAYKLRFDGIRALPYHAGLDAATRTEHQNRFLRDDAQVMVATIAFGMGINKPDVRFVVHFDLPRNIEGYYQESGRAGRDGEPARCTLFFGLGDVKTVEYLISQKVDPNTGAPLEDEQRIATQQLRRVINYAEATDCRRRIQLAYFGEDFPGDCRACDNCCHPKPVEDWTIEAQKFLSCVARCRERFGMNHIIDVLRGSKNQKIIRAQHDQLSTYGIGKERSVEEWRHLGRSLLHQRLMDDTSDGYSVLKLNELSWEILRQQRQVMIAVPNAVRQDVTSTLESSLNPTDAEALLQRLYDLRKSLADQQSVPPYIIFANASLRAMVQHLPQTSAQFAQISGVGSRKLAQYGEAFMAEISAFCQERGLTPNANGSLIHTVTKREEATAASFTQLQTLELYQQGLKPVAIAEQRNLRLSTITTHLAELLELGYEISLDHLVPTDRQGSILQAIKTVGPDSLSLLREHLGEVYGYDEIRLVRAAWRRQH
jgi:ATP-dependent DNA helicase RecQ